MGISKVILNGVTKVDLTSDTVEANKLLSGIKATGADGNSVTGNIASRSSTDLTASGATVTVPAGHYASQASKIVASGTAGTPTATKGTVSNHAVTVTPSVTNTAGYITGGTQTGTAVTVNVAELESGTKTITENGTGISVSGYSTVDVDVAGSGGYTATITNSTDYWQPIKVNGTGTNYYKDGTTFEFNDGDTLQFFLAGTRADGILYLNGTQIALGYNTNYTWTPTVYCDIGIEIVEGTTSHVYITTPVLNVTTNGSYPIPGYGYVNVSV